MRDWIAAAGSRIQKEQNPLVSTGFGPGAEEVWADADLNLARETNKSGKNGNRGMGKRLYTEKITKQKKNLTRKKRRRGRTVCRQAKKQAERSRVRTRRQEVCIATHNVRTIAVDGKHGIDRAWEVLSALRKLGCDVIGIQGTRRSG